MSVDGMHRRVDAWVAAAVISTLLLYSPTPRWVETVLLAVTSVSVSVACVWAVRLLRAIRADDTVA